MVFAGLHEHDKEAFFSLLDEYFQSRPHLLAAQSGPSEQGVQPITPAQAVATASAGAALFGRAMAANPHATTAVVNAGLRSAGAPKGVQLAPPPPHAAGNEQEADDTAAAKTSVADRIAKFGAGFKPPAPMPPAKPASSSFIKPTAPPPPAPPRLPGRASRTPEPQEEEPEEEIPVPEPPRRAGFTPKAPASPPAGLVTTKSFGNYDTTSKGSFAASLVTRKGPAKRQDSVTPPIPSAFPPKPQQNFAPPPVRRVPSDSSSNPGSARKTPPVPRREEIEQEEEAGEWADVLYDYNSGEPTDLVIEEGQRILVIEKSSPDWWKGQFNGKEGLFPSSYVRIL